MPMQLRRARQNFSFIKIFENLRPFWVFIIGLGTAYVLWWSLGSPNISDIPELVNKIIETGNAPWTIITIIISAPTAYVIWVFRDHNNRMQIENQRKDINLKDFQKLSEWASGLHIPEKKIIKTNVVKAQGTDTTQTTETNEQMEGVLNNHPSHHDGAAALQISAINQLEAFLQGDYGKSFRRPAFQLLKSLWFALMQPLVDPLDEIEETLHEIIQKSHNKDYCYKSEKTHVNPPRRDSIKKTIRSPLFQSINAVICSGSGKIMRDHALDLTGACFAFLNTNLTSTKSLELFGLKLIEINFQESILPNINLQRTKLEHINFNKSNLSNANLECSVMRYTKLQEACIDTTNFKGSYVFQTNFENADLIQVNFQGAYIRSTSFKNAFLFAANFQGSDIIHTNFQGANLSHANLKGVLFLNYYYDKGSSKADNGIDENTKFDSAIADKNTIIKVVIWENDEFIIDEEKSKALREQMERQGLEFVDD